MFACVVAIFAVHAHGKSMRSASYEQVVLGIQDAVKEGKNLRVAAFDKNVLALTQHLESEEGVRKVEGIYPQFANDNDHGLCFKMGGKWETNYEKQRADGWKKLPTWITKGISKKEKTKKPSSVEFVTGVSFDAKGPTPFAKLTINFGAKICEMFKTACDLISKAVAKALGIQAKGMDSIRKIAAAAGKVKGWLDKVKEYPAMAKILQYADKGIGGANDGGNSNDGLTVNFLFEDPGNKGNPSLAFEWRKKDANTFTAFCMDLIAPPHPGCLTGAWPGGKPFCFNMGTCGAANQGIHFQSQIGNINFVKALGAVMLPATKTLDSAEYHTNGKATGPYKVAALQADVKKNFATVTAACKTGNKGLCIGKKLLQAVLKGVQGSIVQATWTPRIEFRVWLLTVGLSKELKVGCYIGKLVGGSDGKCED